MSESKFEKYAPLSGAVFVLLILIAVALYNLYAYLPTADELVDFLSANSTRVTTAG